MDDQLISNLIRLLLSCLCAFIIGVEREKEHKPAGLRTCIVLCFTMALLMIINEELVIFFKGNCDVLRLPAYCIMSIGFLGSGIIICHKGHVEGVTTACILLLLVAIGVLCGINKIDLAFISTIFAYFILKLKHITKYIK